MTVNPSPLGGFAAQFFDNNGVILSGGKIYTYAAGTTTPRATYTDSLGNTAHANPIILDSAGRVPGGEIWLSDGLGYKFVIETSTGSLIGSYDNIFGINANFSATLILNIATLKAITWPFGRPEVVQVINNYVVGDGGGFFRWDSASTATDNLGTIIKETATTTGRWFRQINESFQAKWFGCVGDGVTVDTVAFLAAMNAAAAINSLLYIDGNILTAPVVVPSGLVGIKGMNGSSVDGIKIIRADYGNGAKLFDATNRNTLILEGWTLDIDDVIFTKPVTTNGAFGLYLDGGTDPIINDITIVGFARHHFFLNGIARTNVDGLTIIGRSVPVTVSAMTRAANVVTATATAHGRVTGEEMALVVTNAADVTYTEYTAITVVDVNTFTYPCPGSNAAATGGGVAHFRMGVGFYTQNAMQDGVYNSIRFLGLFTYGFVWGAGINERAYNIRCEGTAVFAISMGACFNCSITGGWVKNSMYEAYQMTNCRDKCYMTDIYAAWDNNRGKDFGASINGLTTGDGLGGDDCSVTDFMFVNSYKCGTAIANNIKNSSFFDGTLENCGVRYTANNPGDTESSVTFIGAAEADAIYDSSVCSGNLVRDILINNPAGTMPLAFCEKVSASRTVSNNSHSGLLIITGVTTIDLFVAASGSWGVDSQGYWRSYSTTLLAAVGNPTTATCSVRWRREGKLVVGSARWDITTNGGSASDYLAFAAPLAPKASSRVETLGGQITDGSLSGSTLYAQFSAANILFRRQASAYPGADGVGGYVSFSYEIT